MSAKPVFSTEFHFHVGDTAFFCRFQPVAGQVPAQAGFLGVMKDRSQIDRYVELCDELRPQVIVELGVKWGGSTAFLHALNRPQLLVSLELTPEPPPDLSAYIAAHGLEAVVRPHYGIDQADRNGVASIMAEELSGRQIDLVIDDASHLLKETRTSFEVLFPLMRPGGVYVIEDWNGHHLIAEGLDRIMADPSHPNHAKLVARFSETAATDQAPDARLVRLPLELVLARASNRDVIREVTVMDNWVVIRRGDEPIEPGSFRLADLVNDYFKNLRPID